MKPLMETHEVKSSCNLELDFKLLYGCMAAYSKSINIFRFARIRSWHKVAEA